MFPFSSEVKVEVEETPSLFFKIKSQSFDADFVLPRLFFLSIEAEEVEGRGGGSKVLCRSVEGVEGSSRAN